MRKIIENTHADAKMIGSVIGLFITLIIAILVLYNMAEGIAFSADTERDINTARGWHTTPVDGMNSDKWNNTTTANNVTGDILDQAGTFFQIAPIIGIVVVATVILLYVGKIGSGTGGGV